MPVHYVVDGGQIVVMLAPSNAHGWHVAGRAVDLVVTGTNRDDLQWLVRATGRASHLPGATHRVHLLGSPHDRPPLLADTPPCQLVITAVSVRGYYETLQNDTSVLGDHP